MRMVWYFSTNINSSMYANYLKKNSIIFMFMAIKIGKVASFRPGTDDDKTLAALKFQTGDFLDIQVNFNNNSGFRQDRWEATTTEQMLYKILLFILSLLSNRIKK